MISLPLVMSDLWPAGAAVVQRVADDSTDWLPQPLLWRERASATPLPFAGAVAVVCHEAAVVPAGLELLRECGLEPAAELLTYRDFAEMCGITEELARRGRSIGIGYSSRRLFAPAAAYVTDPGVFAELNDKASVGRLLPPEAAPRRCVIARRELARMLQRSRPPLVLKASSRLGSGGGRDVVICRTPEDLARAPARLARAEHIVVEEFCRFDENWCLHYAASDAGVRYCGAAEQICDDAGIYAGNWCRRGVNPADEAIAIGRHAAEAGWCRGYRGFLGVDVGRTDDGRWLAFDLNFRNNGSTIQVLLRDALAEAWGAACTRIRHGLRFNGAYAEMLERLRAFHARRALVPVLVLDAEQIDPADARPLCNVVAAGAGPDAVRSILSELGSAGFDPR